MADDDAGSEQQSKDERAVGVGRMLSDEDPPEEPPTNDPEPPGEVGGASDVGKSTTASAEDTAKKDKEPGREDTGTEGAADRPTGTSTARDATGTEPQDGAD